MKNKQQKCPFKRFGKCSGDNCAAWMTLYGPDDNPIGGECALHSLGHVNYSLKALVGILHAHLHMTEDASIEHKSADAPNGEGRRKLK